MYISFYLLVHSTRILNLSQNKNKERKKKKKIYVLPLCDIFSDCCSVFHFRDIFYYMTSFLAHLPKAIHYVNFIFDFIYIL